MNDWSRFPLGVFFVKIRALCPKTAVSLQFSLAVFRGGTIDGHFFSGNRAVSSEQGSFRGRRDHVRPLNLSDAPSPSSFPEKRFAEPKDVSSLEGDHPHAGTGFRSCKNSGKYDTLQDRHHQVHFHIVPNWKVSFQLINQDIRTISIQAFDMNRDWIN